MDLLNQPPNRSSEFFEKDLPSVETTILQVVVPLVASEIRLIPHEHLISFISSKNTS
jgi:hypothetical protein